ncbi:UDP-N-acetylmuramate: L-alanyl-gamma-D-glutamyl-meso-diaminopimelate ligase [Polaromonas sp. CG_9.5]|uniref:UDP-N-acetylmuramate:L-alanyl-gamma-D-glutamyl- meso-diaminopimelate ligase n=1 Tax=Polaromonas sp. CG_9.5 TaxID=3071705 RepID=UPI002DF957C2|nr:UDP-N-acetylmuramate: L-alanyl-gamma-D-glutamyl-meso-diaminopimelate ligase [Polaromonas sp. CG_9.5]
MHIHILGICGTFMGGLAALAREAGHKVTGCDTGVYPPMSDQLRGLGIELIEGYSADQMALAPDVFVIGNVVSRARLADGSPKQFPAGPPQGKLAPSGGSAAHEVASVGAKYPLMEAILNSGQPYTSGPQWLSGHVLHHPTHHATGPRHVLAVAGTHGKTTTTAMLAWILECAGLQPGFLIGGVPLNFGVSARLGTGNTFVIEADEYDTAFFDKRSKFVHYRPRTAVLNNLEFDHADIFDDLAAIERQFHHLVRTVPSQGRVVVNATEESLQRVLAQGCWSEQVPFGGSVQHAGFSAQGEPGDFTVHKNGETVARVQWDISGVHNQLNALAAIAAAEHVGVSPALAAEALASFQNVKRRMEVRGVVQRDGCDITVYDDFAHHPTAIHTTVDGLRRQLDGAGKTAERILAIFEPRSNTMKLGAMTAQLPWSLERADLAFCHAGGLDWDARAALASMGERAQVADSIEQLLAQVTAAARPGDHLLCMSNGGFGGIHARLLAALKA